MLNHISYPTLNLTTLQSWWAQYSQASTPLSIKYLTQCDSTNVQLYRTTTKCNTLLVAERQTHGKGQFERTWISQSGDIIFSLGLLLSPKQLPCLSLRVGLALAQVLRQYGLTVQLKWPNDVIASHPHTGQRGKLAGILVQNTAISSESMWTVIGIGMNVGARLLPLSASASGFAPLGLAQLSEFWIDPHVGERDVLLMQLVDTILVHLETASLQNDLPSVWNPLDLWHKLPVTLIDSKGVEHHGIGQGINIHGAYQLTEHTGKITAFHSGQLLPAKENQI